MIGTGTIVNVALVLAGGTAGLLLKKILSQRLTDTIMQGIGLAVAVIGISGTLGSQYTLMMIISLAVGALIGEIINIEAKLEAFAEMCERKFTAADKNSAFVQGFVSASLVFCVGAMSIVGAIEDGMNGNPQTLFAKSALDAVTAMIFASAMGAGVLFSAVAVGVYQGLITILAIFVAPYLNGEVIAQTSLIGSVLILAIGLNMLKITKIKVGNLLPAIFVPVVYYIIRLFL